MVFKEDSIHAELQLFSDQKKAGKMDISVADGKLRVYHTEVEAEYEGKGFAKLLLDELVGYAKENSLRIIPLCPYVLAQFKRHPEEYSAVWLKRMG